MKIIQYIFLFIFTLSHGLSFTQNDKVNELNQWIEENQIVFNSPDCPPEFEHFLQCDEKHGYRKVEGDTIIIYSRGGATAENLESLKESIKSDNFNVFRYPRETQKNGTIIMQEMRKWTFLKRGDTLYLYDDFDEKKALEHISIFEAYFEEEIDETEYKKQLDELSTKDFGFQPKFKMIYYKGIFDESSSYTFTVDQNFKEEQVNLVKTWEEDGKVFFLINLKTWTAGRYIISEDFEFIGTEKCGE